MAKDIAPREYHGPTKFRPKGLTIIFTGDGKGKSSAAYGVVLRALGLSADKVADLPEHIHLVLADAKVNTYDIVEVADLGLVYTTTVGMEMVMSGVPVIVVGKLGDEVAAARVVAMEAAYASARSGRWEDVVA